MFSASEACMPFPHLAIDAVGKNIPVDNGKRSARGNHRLSKRFTGARRAGRGGAGCVMGCGT